MCGCCTVVLNGKAVSGCLYLAALADGSTIQAIEHSENGLDHVQEAFIEAGAFQCGFCTPGYILMARQLLAAIRIRARKTFYTISLEICAAAALIADHRGCPDRSA